MAVLYVIYLTNRINRPICLRRYQIAPCITRAYNKHALRLIVSHLLSCLLPTGNASESFPSMSASPYAHPRSYLKRLFRPNEQTQG